MTWFERRRARRSIAVLRRHAAVEFWMSAALIGLLPASCLPLLLDPPALALSAALVAVGICAMPVFAVVATLRRSALIRVVREHRGAICTSCAYPLAAGPPSGQCPECGAAFDRAKTVAQWTAAEPGWVD